jgi:hypothetical protein
VKITKLDGLSRSYLAYIVHRVTTLLKHIIKLVWFKLIDGTTDLFGRVAQFFSLTGLVLNKLPNDHLEYSLIAFPIDLPNFSFFRGIDVDFC